MTLTAKEATQFHHQAMSSTSEELTGGDPTKLYSAVFERGLLANKFTAERGATFEPGSQPTNTI